MKKLVFILSLLLMGSCASIPPESIDLMNIIIQKNEKSYELNVALVNKLFAEKSEDIDEFIDSKYTQEYWENFKESIPDDVDVEKEMGSIIPAVSASINKQRNLMQRTLETSKIQILKSINDDYEISKISTNQLKELIESATKLNAKRSEILQQYSNKLNLDININEIESSIDSFIISAGDKGADVEKLGNEFLNQIDKLTKK